MAINNVKGTHDIYGNESGAYTAIENLLKTVAEIFTYSEMRPPVLEHSEVFIRGVGEGSDVVRKEMYTFLDKADRSITLRPEFTAGIMRVIAQNKLFANVELPLKYYYSGPVFRYERPQLGRYRQFNQFGVEAVGNNSPYLDLEIISMAYTMLQSLGLENVKIKINSLGDEASRNSYKEALKDYFRPYLENMCDDCKSRFELNPLRILDCKVPEDHEIALKCPAIKEYLSEESKSRFDLVVKGLEEMDIPYEIDDGLVRGLDYYSETVFEFQYTSKMGKDYGAIGGGGHYDKLLKELGGADLPGIGFSFGIERLYSVLVDDGLINPNEEDNIDIYVMASSEAKLQALIIANRLRMYGYRIDYCFDDTKLANMLKRADKKNAYIGLIIGEDELRNGTVTIKNMATKEQMTVPNENVDDEIANMIEEREHHMHHHCDCGCEDEHSSCHDDGCECEDCKNKKGLN